MASSKKLAKHSDPLQDLPKSPFAVVWLRRDLRLEDNTALSAALQSGVPVVPIFIFDPAILSKLSDRKDRRVHFIRDRLAALQEELRERGSDLAVFHEEPERVFRRLAQGANVYGVFINHDYEPYAIERDARVAKVLKDEGVRFETFKDQVVFEKREVAKADGLPYTVFTPYSKKWLAQLTDKDLAQRPCDKGQWAKWQGPDVPTLAEIGFEVSTLVYSAPKLDLPLIKKYADTRDVPSLPGTTRLGIHLRFGTISPREAVKVARKSSEIWLK